jgi:hypothetical protein
MLRMTISLNYCRIWWDEDAFVILNVVKDRYPRTLILRYAQSDSINKKFIALSNILIIEKSKIDIE